MTTKRDSQPSQLEYSNVPAIHGNGKGDLILFQCRDGRMMFVNKLKEDVKVEWTDPTKIGSNGKFSIHCTIKPDGKNFRCVSPVSSLSGDIGKPVYFVRNLSMEAKDNPGTVKLELMNDPDYDTVIKIL
jgi:hypothetical protein